MHIADMIHLCKCILMQFDGYDRYLAGGTKDAYECIFTKVILTTKLQEILELKGFKVSQVANPWTAKLDTILVTEGVKS